MRIVELVRLESGEQGTFGVLKIDKQAFCCTLEPRDRLNANNISAIPPGQYIAVRHQSPKFGETFMVKDVPGRTNILFHKGNTDDDTAGCIILGSSFGHLGADRAVLASGKAFGGFTELFKRGIAPADLRFHLTITEHY